MSGTLQNPAVAALAGAGTSIAAGLLLLKRYLEKELQAPRLLHGHPEDEAHDQIMLLKIRLLLNDYWPHPFLEFSGYTSTIWSGINAVIPRKCPGSFEELTLADGGKMLLHWADPPDEPSDRVVLVLPGVNNHSKMGFIQETMRHFRSEGYHAVSLNYRGMLGMKLSSPRIGWFDAWQDLPEVAAHIKAVLPHAQLFGVGFSMGGMVLLKHLGEAGEQTMFTAAVTVGAPVDLPAVAAALESSVKKLGMNLILTMGSKVKQMRTLLSSQYWKHIDTARFWRATTLAQLQAVVVCPLHGYESSDQINAVNSPASTLAQITSPVLVIQAEDDPVVSAHTLPVELLKSNPNIYVALTRRGGHLAYGSGGLGAASWTDSMAVRFSNLCATGKQHRVHSRSRL